MRPAGAPRPGLRPGVEQVPGKVQPGRTHRNKVDEQLSGLGGRREVGSD